MAFKTSMEAWSHLGIGVGRVGGGVISDYSKKP